MFESRQSQVSALRLRRNDANFEEVATDSSKFAASASQGSIGESRLNTYLDAYSQLASDLSCRLTSISSCLGACEALLSSANLHTDQRLAIENAFQLANQELNRAGISVRSGRRLLNSNAGKMVVQGLNTIIEDTLNLTSSRFQALGIRVRMQLDRLPHILLDASAIRHVLITILNQAYSAQQNLPEERREVIIKTRSIGNFVECVLSCAIPTGNACIDSCKAPSSGVTLDGNLGSQFESCLQAVKQHGGQISRSSTADNHVSFCFSLRVRTEMGITRSGESNE